MVVAATLAMSGCGSSGTSTSTTTVGGSAGDGPVKSGTVTVVDANGATVTTTPATVTTDSTGHYSFTVPSNTATPLKITVTGGTDVVTGAAPDFPLVTAVTTLPASGSVTGNANPLSTLAVAAAEALGGLNAANLTTAVNNVKNTLGFGIDFDPISTEITSTNVAKAVKAHEAAAELIRRVVASSATSGISATTTAKAIAAIAADVTDGALDGSAASGVTGADAKVAAVALAKQAEVAAEVVKGTLKITDTAGTTVVADATTKLNNAITVTQPTVTAPDITAVPVTAAFKTQALAAAKAVQALAGGAGSNTTLDTLVTDFGNLTPGNTAATEAAKITVAVSTISTAVASATTSTNVTNNATTATSTAASTLSFKLSANSLQLTDYDASNVAQTPQTVTVASVASNVMTVNAPSTGLNDANLRNLAKSSPTGTAPKIAFGLANLPAGSGTATVTALLKDGTTATRTSGQRQLKLVFDVDWSSDGSTLTLTAAAGNATATYFTANGAAAVSTTLTNASANILSVGSSITVPNAQAQLNAAIANIFNVNSTIGAALQNVNVSAGQNFYYQIDFSNFRLTDVNGNLFTTVKGTFSLADGTAPAAPVITSPTANSTVTTNTPTVSGTAEANATIKLYSGVSTKTLVGTTTANGSGAWTVTSSSLVNGNHTLTATATDAAGNVSTSSTGVLIVVNGNPNASGAVVDGRVKNANLTLYSDAAMTQQVGSGTTNNSGAFSITLTASTMPDPVYIKSVGGTDIDTGMPAPTMRFVGNTSGTNALTTFNITPLTEDVVDRMDKGASLASAQTTALSSFGLSGLTGGGAGLYDDPSANTTLQAAEFKKLAAGTMGATIGAGNYKMFAIALDESDVGATQISGIGATTDTTATTLLSSSTQAFIAASISVDASGNISGGSTSTGFFRGKIVGSSMMFDIVDSQTPSSVTTLTRVVGNIGLNGSVAGNFTDISGLGGGTPQVTKGVFVGSVIPSTGVNAANLATFISNFYTPGTTTGLMNIVARDIFTPSTQAPSVNWGQAAVTGVNLTAGTVTMGNMTMRSDGGTNSGINGGSASGSVATASTTTMTFSNGVFVKDANGLPTNLLVFEYTLGADKLYIATAVGLRRSIYFFVPSSGPTAGKITTVGDAYMSKVDSVAPNGFTAGATHDVTVADIHPGMPGSPRTQALNEGLQPTSAGAMTIPSGITVGNGFWDPNSSTPAPELMVFQGSMFVMKKDDNNDFGQSLVTGTVDDHLRVVEFFESGAMQGEEIMGGTITPPGGGAAVPMRDFPGNFVGFVHNQADPVPSFSGTLNFLARTMYANNYGAFINAYTAGTLSITAPVGTTAGSATLTVTDDGTGNAGSAPISLTVDAPSSTTPGVYHIRGVLTPASTGNTGEYIDITWPIGGTKALYAISDNANGNGTITEVGEAYLTQ